VSCILFSIGGSNSSSILPYIDYEYIRQHPKIVCGYSDATAIHCALQKKARLCTFYGPALIPSFGEFPMPHDVTVASWEIQVGLRGNNESYFFSQPETFSDHFIDATKPGWKKIEREFRRNDGWKALRRGAVTAPIFAYNLNTLLALAGTEYFPELKGCILCIEQMDTDMAKEERQLNQLKLMGVLDELEGLIISKPEKFLSLNATFSYDELVLEILEGTQKQFPIVTNFDCGHTHPMLTIVQGVKCKLSVEEEVTLQQMGRGVC
jgi:muramoyltetrapeptide carboxypeptidase LdcA involved in peptidoglycan recycling